MKKPKTVKNMQSVFDKLIEFVKDNERDIKLIAEKLDGILIDFYVEYSEKTNPTVSELQNTWEWIMDEAKHSDEARKDISKLFNNMLDDMLGNDFFGTEGQCDPRGDHRD